MERVNGGALVEIGVTEDEVREVKAQLRATFSGEKILLHEMQRWAALHPDAAQGRAEALRLYRPRLDELLARRRKLVERLLAMEEPRLQAAYARLRALTEEEVSRPGTPMRETPAVSH